MRTVRTISVIAVSATIAMSCATAFGQPRKPEATIIFQSIKIIPKGATLEYRIDGQTVQTLGIPTGRYQILISQLR